MTANTPKVTPFTVTVDGAQLHGIRRTPESPRAKAVLLPGAGGTFAGTGLACLAELVAVSGVDTLTINLLHNEKRRPPANLSRNVAALQTILTSFAPKTTRLLVGGKSYGARVALSYAATTRRIDGVIAYGFPLHAPGKTTRRDTMFAELAVPGLFVQGSRDPFGSATELSDAVKRYAGDATVVPLAGGNHDGAVAKKHAPDGVKREPVQALTEQAEAITQWVKQVTGCG